MDTGRSGGLGAREAVLADYVRRQKGVATGKRKGERHACLAESTAPWRSLVSFSVT